MTEEDAFEASWAGAAYAELFSFEMNVLERAWAELETKPYPQEVKVAYMKRIIERLGVT